MDVRDALARPSVRLPGRRALALAVGDHLVIAAIVAYGIVDHHGAEKLQNAGEVLETVGPFVGGFFVAALVVGCYATDRHRTLLASLRSVLGAWFGGLGLGLVLRTWPEIEGGATWPFGLVILGAVGSSLLAWRTIEHALRRWQSAPRDAPGREAPGE